MNKPKEVRSISFLVYKNSDLTTKYKDDVIKYQIPLINMSQCDALTLKASIQLIPNVGGIVSVNLNNGNML